MNVLPVVALPLVALPFLALPRGGSAPPGDVEGIIPGGFDIIFFLLFTGAP